MSRPSAVSGDAVDRADTLVPARAGLVAERADLAALVALAGLPWLTPKQFWDLVAERTPVEAWRWVVAGGTIARPGSNKAGHWRRYVARVDPWARLAEHERAGVRPIAYAESGYPYALLEDPEPPVMLFAKGPGGAGLAAGERSGDTEAIVAIVGTRMASGYGLDIARELGAGLAGRGVRVVSGLARGIDAAAHLGVARVDPTRLIGVVASGVDVIYPPSSSELWTTTAESGVLISEWPCGSRSLPWRFPARNRLVAALAQIVVVVESASKGGSLYTCDEANTRNRDVVAVPGPIRSPASAGTNNLILDGAQIMCSIAEFLDQVAPAPNRDPKQLTLGAGSGGVESWLLDLIGWQAMSVEAIVAACADRSPAEVLVEAERLLNAGVVVRRGGVLERKSG